MKKCKKTRKPRKPMKRRKKGKNTPPPKRNPMNECRKPIKMKENLRNEPKEMNIKSKMYIHYWASPMAAHCRSCRRARRSEHTKSVLILAKIQNH